MTEAEWNPEADAKEVATWGVICGKCGKPMRAWKTLNVKLVPSDRNGPLKGIGPTMTGTILACSHCDAPRPLDWTGFVAGRN